MTTDSSAPATQGDLAALEHSLEKKIDVLIENLNVQNGKITSWTVDIDGKFTSLAEHVMGEIGKLYDAQERWKDEILERMDERFSKEHLYTGALIENLRDDIYAVHGQRITILDDRLTRVERKTGIVT